MQDGSDSSGRTQRAHFSENAYENNSDQTQHARDGSLDDRGGCQRGLLLLVLLSVLLWSTVAYLVRAAWELWNR